MLVAAEARGAVSARVNAGTETESARSNPAIEREKTRESRIPGKVGRRRLREAQESLQR